VPAPSSGTADSAIFDLCKSVSNLWTAASMNCSGQSVLCGRFQTLSMHHPETLSGAIGGFNVSNYMGIKRRMIDIGKKITFYFLQIV
jgi:hypothetical protein